MNVSSSGNRDVQSVARLKERRPRSADHYLRFTRAKVGALVFARAAQPHGLLSGAALVYLDVSGSRDAHGAGNPPELAHLQIARAARYQAASLNLDACAAHLSRTAEMYGEQAGVNRGQLDSARPRVPDVQLSGSDPGRADASIGRVRDTLQPGKGDVNVHGSGRRQNETFTLSDLENPVCDLDIDVFQYVVLGLDSHADPIGDLDSQITDALERHSGDISYADIPCHRMSRSSDHPVRGFAAHGASARSQHECERAEDPQACFRPHIPLLSRNAFLGLLVTARSPLFVFSMAIFLAGSLMEPLRFSEVFLKGGYSL